MKPSVFPILTSVAMFCGFAIALVFEATAEQIASNRAEPLEFWRRVAPLEFSKRTEPLEFCTQVEPLEFS